MHAHVFGSRRLVRTLERNWWLLAFRGGAAILFGLIAMTWPVITLTVLVLIYGAFVAVDGAFALAAAVKGGSIAHRWWLATVGVMGLLIGAITLLWPQLTALVLVMFIAGWAMTTGILQIIGALKLRREITDEWLLIASGVVSVLFSLGLLLWPGTAAVALTFAIGAFAIVYGALLVAFSLRLREHQLFTAQLRA